MPPPEEKWLMPEFITYCIAGFVLAVPPSFLVAWLIHRSHAWWVWPIVFWLLSLAVCGGCIIISCIRKAIRGGIEETQI
jgi:hypothetical protein